jgi:hypothetical protein
MITKYFGPNARNERNEDREYHLVIETELSRSQVYMRFLKPLLPLSRTAREREYRSIISLWLPNHCICDIVGEFSKQDRGEI